jgi:positive regulator of sigma E activity
MITLELLATAVSAGTALLGVIVAWLAVRGYRRNDSEVMWALAVGVVAIAVVPFIIIELLSPVILLTDAQALLGATVSHAVGLLSIYRTFGDN